jgi:hypothetical protein
LQELEVSFPAHLSRSQQVLDDEDWDFTVGGNDERTNHARLCIDEMIATLMIEGKTILLEHFGQNLVVNAADRGHYRTLTFCRLSATNSGASQAPFFFW